MEVKAVRNVVSGDRHKLPKPIRKTRLPEVRKCMCFQNSLSTRSTLFAILSKRNDFQNFCKGSSQKFAHRGHKKERSYGTLPPPPVLKRKCDRQWEKCMTNGFKCTGVQVYFKDHLSQLGERPTILDSHFSSRFGQ